MTLDLVNFVCWKCVCTSGVGGEDKAGGEKGGDEGREKEREYKSR